MSGHHFLPISKFTAKVFFMRMFSRLLPVDRSSVFFRNLERLRANMLAILCLRRRPSNLGICRVGLSRTSRATGVGDARVPGAVGQARKRDPRNGTCTARKCNSTCSAPRATCRIGRSQMFLFRTRSREDVETSSGSLLIFAFGQVHIPCADAPVPAAGPPIPAGQALSAGDRPPPTFGADF